MATGFLGLVQLFCIFFYVGLFAVGGGLVAATFMQQILVERYGVLSMEKFYSMLAISESTPGPIGINLATYCGTELYGPFGGVIATIGEVLPAIIVITIISKFLAGFQKKPLVQSAFEGVRPATAGMVLIAALNVFMITLLDIPAFKASGAIIDLFVSKFRAIAFYIPAVVLLFIYKKMHPIFVIIAGALFGVFFL